MKTNLTKRIIPCLDVKDRRVVKGINFKNLKDAGDPIQLGKKYSEEGADELVFLDITASNEKRNIVCDLVSQVSKNVFIPFTVGGGIKSIEDVRAVISSGADKVTINTAAVLNPELIKEGANAFGRQCMVVAIDTKNINGQNKVFIKGGREETKLELLEWAKEVEKLGAGEILLTSMDKDGTKEGFDNDLLKKISKIVNIPIIASGGAGTLEHLQDAFTKGKADAVLAASIFHYGEIGIREVKNYLSKKGIQIRNVYEKNDWKFIKNRANTRYTKNVLISPILFF